MPLRTDIQALRGLAVLLVMFHHSELGPFQAGYLGVDVFFVISGYLITRIVARDIEAGSFSFSAFYFRRAKRLLPAAYVTFLVTVIVAPLVLGVAELRDFAKQVLGAVTFTGNFVLLQQTGYFESDAAVKPLLHVWSLAIEEQYYLLLPAAMVFVPRRFWLSGAFAIVLLSFAGGLVLAMRDPDSAFYLLPSRAWELCIGSVGALARWDGPRMRRSLRALYWPALAGLLVLPLAPLGPLHPGPDALLVCLATLVVILRQHEGAERNGPCRLLAKVGDCSYSLYLVHWPVLALTNNAYLGAASDGVRTVALLVGAVGGYLLYRYIESPIRQATVVPARAHLRAALGASAGLTFLAYSTVWAHGLAGVDYGHLRRANRGLDGCTYREGFAEKPECRTAESPRIAIWGDSFAMHLVSGLAATTDAGVIQAARSNCGPFLGLAPLNDHRETRERAERCIAFNREVVEYIAASPSIEVVVLSSPFASYLSSGRGDQVSRTLAAVDGRLSEQSPGLERAVEAMRETVAALRGSGKRVIIVGPPPAADYDVAACLERRASGKLLFGDRRDCQILVAAVEQKQGLVRKFLDEVEARLDVPVVRFDELLCDERTCRAELDGTFLYRDSGHLSYDGSRALARKLGLGTLVLARAK